MLRLSTTLIIAATLSVPGICQERTPKLLAAQASSSGLNIEVSWREIGLWPEMPIHNTVTAEASATYICIDRGEMADRRTVEELVSAEGDFDASAHGRAAVRLTLKPPTPGIFSCAPGQQLRIACAAFTRLTCKDERYAISQELRRSFVVPNPDYSGFCNIILH